VKFPFVFALALTATVATGQSYVSPGATAIVGIRWSNLRDTSIAAAVEAQVSALGLPNLDCLRTAREVLISSPELLAVVSGAFPPGIIEAQAQQAGLHGQLDRGVTLWLPNDAGKLGIAQLSDQLLLAGTQKTLEAALDRGASASALLTRAASFAETADLWVAARKLPDPLAARFVPVDARGSGFLGRVTMRDGIAVQAFFDAGSERDAAEFVQSLHEKALSFPPAARGVEAARDQSRVTIALQVSPEAVALELRPPVLDLADGSGSSGEPEATQAPFKFEVTHTEASTPRIIRIFNLPEGTREVTLPFAH
jgi:hypothetical protein